MPIDTRNRLLCLCLLAVAAPPAAAANRVQPGQWESTMNIAGQAVTKSICMTQADADAINGDVQSIRAYAEKLGASVGCKVTDVKADGNRVTVKSVCASGRENIGMTTYRGDSFETVNNNGVRSQSKRVGACK
jgi:hypothetical protein